MGTMVLLMSAVNIWHIVGKWLSMGRLLHSATPCSVFGDVVAMYPNIPIDDGIQIVADLLGISPLSLTLSKRRLSFTQFSCWEWCLKAVLCVLNTKYNHSSVLFPVHS
jgi:hypothetical protein